MSMITPVAILVNTSIKIYEEIGGRPVSERRKNDGPEGPSREESFLTTLPRTPKTLLREYLYQAYRWHFLPHFMEICPRVQLGDGGDF